MDALLQLWQNQWDAYPHWLVLSSLAISVALLLWLATKFLAWVFKILLIGTLIGVAVGLIFHFFI